jgi:hypothetical protein
LEVAAEWGDQGLDEPLQRLRAGLEALAITGAVSEASATEWRERLACQEPALADPGLRESGERLLEALLEASDPKLVDFGAALGLLRAVGAVDYPYWDARRRERLGQPSAEEERAVRVRINADATHVDLLDVVPGPAESRHGYRLLLVWRFSDGVSFDLDKEDAAYVDWPEWHLSDDLGTAYTRGGVSGDDDSDQASFRTPIPARAAWIELGLKQHAGVSFRVTL